MRAMLAFLLGFPVASAGAAEAALTSGINDVMLENTGAAAVSFEAGANGRLHLSLAGGDFAADDLALSLQSEDARYLDEGETVDADGYAVVAEAPRGTLNVALLPGSYRLELRSASGESGLVQLFLRFSPGPDAHEPNDTRAQAADITLPFDELISVSAEDPAWYRFTAPEGRVIAIHLQAGYYEGPYFAVYDDAGEFLYVTEPGAWAHYGVRYVRATGAPMFLHVSDTVGGNNPSAWKRLLVRVEEPVGAPEGTLVRLDLGDDVAAANQLELVGLGLGLRVADATDAAEISTRLTEAVERVDEERSVWSWVLLALALAAVSALALWRTGLHRRLLSRL